MNHKVKQTIYRDLPALKIYRSAMMWARANGKPFGTVKEQKIGLRNYLLYPSQLN